MTMTNLARAIAAALLFALASIPPSKVAVAAPIPAQLSLEDRVLIDRIEAYLNSLFTMQARFVQASSNGGAAQGQVFLSRPGRMRIEYDPPVPVLMVADGKWLIYVDRKLSQVSHVPLASTPVSVLTRERVSLTGGDVIMTGFERSGRTARITLVQASDPYSGKVTLVFDTDPVMLKQWTVVDAQGITTDVVLIAPDFGKRLDPKLFVFDDGRLGPN